MEVHCESCPAKYAVPDEKVRGKKVRIKCKHCGSAIVVDGTSLGRASAAPKAEAAARPAAAAAATPAQTRPAAAGPAPRPAPAQPATAAAPKPAAAPAASAGWREPAKETSPAAAAGSPSSAWREPAAMPARGIKRTMLGIPPPAAAAAPAPPPAAAPPPAPAAAPAAIAAATAPRPAAKATLVGGLDAPAAAARAAVSAARPAEPAASPPRSVKRTMLGIPAPAGELPLKPEAPRAAATEPAPPPEPQHGVAELESGAEPEWTVAITDEQHEEMTTEQVIAAFSDGTINDDTFIWADGMDDWKNPFEIPLLAAELESRGFGPGSGGARDEEATVVAEAPSDVMSSRGVWREPGSWRAPAPGGGEEEGDISFDDVTVSMDSSKAQELLRAAGADDAAPQRGLGDTLLDDAAHDDVTLAVDSRPFFAESAPLVERRAGYAPQEEPPLDWDDEQTMAMDAPPISSSDGRMTGARNEDSVLFSLDALAQSERPAAPPKAERADDDFLLAKPEPIAPMPRPMALDQPLPATPQIRPAPPMPPPPPMMAAAPMPPAPQPMMPAAQPMMPPHGIPPAPQSYHPSAVAAIASAPYPPHSVQPKRASRAWLWILLFFVLAGGALGASYYFRQPARVWQMLDGLLQRAP